MRRFMMLIIVAAIIAGINQVSHAGHKVVTIHGRVFVNNKPVSGANIIVEDVRTGRVIATAYSRGCNPGPNSGYYYIAGLPAKRKLAITAIYKAVNGNTKRMKLSPISDRRVNLFVYYTRPPR